MKVKKFIRSNKNIIIVVLLVVVAVLLAVHTIISDAILAKDDGIELQANTNVNPRYRAIMESGTAALAQSVPSTAENTVSDSTPATKQETTAPKTTAAKSTAAETTQEETQVTTNSPTENIPFATAIKPETPADYNAQWDLGYLIAIDNPDTSYSCAKITLTEKDRDLLERLCMGEFGSGGFIGACLIAQSVKDAMCFDGFKTVEEVIKKCHYTGSTDIGTSDECRRAVHYIFDENRDAVQHRIMYMYNPYMVQSAFHESQNFILSFAGVRFFDRWNY